MPLRVMLDQLDRTAQPKVPLYHGPERRGVPFRKITVDLPAYDWKQLSFKETIQRAVYGCGRSLKVIAAELDMTAPELSRKLADNPNDPVHFPAHRIADLIESTKDLGPLFWLIHRFLAPQEDEALRLVKQITAHLPEVKRLLELLEARERTEVRAGE